LRDRYRLPQKNVRGLEHALAYRGLESGAIDATDLYSTDAEIRYYDLRVLQDDLHHFPHYFAVLLYRDTWAKQAEAVETSILQLWGRGPRAAIVEMNSRAKPRAGQRVPESRVAAAFLAGNPFFYAERRGQGTTLPTERSVLRLIVAATGEHLLLLAISLPRAIIVAVPPRIAAASPPLAWSVSLASVGLIHTTTSR